jgi:DNA replication protein DnaC
VFACERLTAALLDRLTHHAHILEFTGADSYRFRQRLHRETGNPDDRATEARMG